MSNIEKFEGEGRSPAVLRASNSERHEHNLTETPNPTEQLIKDLRIKSNMIAMGERIAYGSDSGIMDAAADALEKMHNQIHEQAALEAEGRRENISKGIELRCRTGASKSARRKYGRLTEGFNKACDEDAAYHRSQVIK